MTSFSGLSAPGSGQDQLLRAQSRLGALANKVGQLSPDEKVEYSRLQSYVLAVPESPSSSSSAGSVGDIFTGQGNLLDKANAFSERQMQLSNQYRGVEGAWQSQIDEQANRRIITDGGQKIDLQKVADEGANLRIKTDGDVKLSLQNNQGSVAEKAKQNDARRALVNFRSDGRGAG